MNMPSVLVNEIFYSLQGEGSRAGRPCAFVRLTGCHLRCAYCDTAYAFHEGTRMDIDKVLRRVSDLVGSGPPLVHITGGEPLLQPAVHPLTARLADAGFTCLLETSGACDIRPCDPRAIRILDIKTPGSGHQQDNLWSNLDHLAAHDEVKFVLTDRNDYDWARRILAEYDLARRCAAVLFSPACPTAASAELAGCPGLPPHQLARWVLDDRLDVTVQIQLHKILWPDRTRGI